MGLTPEELQALGDRARKEKFMQRLSQTDSTILGAKTAPTVPPLMPEKSAMQQAPEFIDSFTPAAMANSAGIIKSTVDHGFESLVNSLAEHMNKLPTK